MRLTTSLLFAALILSTGAEALAQTWVDARTTPALREVVAVDPTGESGWPFGAEDIAQDGPDQFKQQEKNIDIRSLYATADNTDFWARLYVSDTASIGGNVSSYIFFDLDGNQATGGTAGAIELHEQFVSDPSGGGYERVVGFAGNGSLIGAWSWNDGTQIWDLDPNFDTSMVAERGTDLDPLRLNVDQHGYVQVTVSHTLTGLDATCQAVLFARTWNDVPSFNYGDVNVGSRAPCVASDSDDDRIADILSIIPCASTADCPVNAICSDGHCLLSNPCTGDADCLADEVCDVDRCVFSGSVQCSVDADCASYNCVSGLCAACEPVGGMCTSELVCAPTGLCIPGGAVVSDDLGGSDVAQPNTDTSQPNTDTSQPNTDTSQPNVDVGGGGDAISGSDADGAGLLFDGQFQGGACSCRALRSDAEPTLPLWLSLGILGFLVSLARRTHS